MKRDKRASGSREWHRGRAAGRRVTGKGSGVPHPYHLGWLAWSASTKPARRKPCVWDAFRVLLVRGGRGGGWGETRQGVVGGLSTVGGKWAVIAGDLGLWALLDVGLKASQLFPGFSLRRCRGQGSHPLRAKGKGGDRRRDY